MLRIIPLKANWTEVVEIEWRCKDGTRYVERRTCPPTATLEARQRPGGEGDSQ